MKNKKKIKNLLVRSNVAFCCKKLEKWSMKIKKIKPTPKSITHKNPTKMSESSKSKNNPKKIRQRPPKYHRDITFITFIKNDKVKKIKISNTKTSLSKFYDLLFYFF